MTSTGVDTEPKETAPVSLIATLRLALLSLVISALSLLASPVVAATVSYQFDYAAEPFVLDCSTLDFANPFNNFTEPDVGYSLWEVDPVTAHIFMTDCVAAQANETSGNPDPSQSGNSDDATNQNDTTTTVTFGGQGSGAQPATTPQPTVAAATGSPPAELPRTGSTGFGYLIASLLGSGSGIASYLRAKPTRRRTAAKKR